MKQTLQLRLGQHLTMTPQLQQAIRLLQLSTLELQAEIQQALESNVMLELEEEGEQETEAEVAAEAAAEEAGERELGGDGGEIPDELPVDSSWEDVYDGAVLYGGGGGDEDERGLEPVSHDGESLRDHLTWQLELTPFSERDRLLATLIIDAIDEDGYLGAGLEEIVAAAGPEVTVEEAEAVLHRIQHFDPPGVGARSLAECLRIQLLELPEETPWRAQALRLVDGHLETLAAGRHAELAEALGVDLEALREVVALVRSLNPRPGSSLPGPPPEYIIPDVIVRKEEGVWRVELNPEATPRVRINPRYAALVGRGGADGTCLRSHLQEARWLIKSLRSRNETLLKVATCIVERQRGFLEHGEIAMKPLILRDVAEAVGIHESTVSRVTTRKYMHTPRGIFEFKYFFSSQIATDDGGAASATAIRALIRKLVEAENPARPLSDAMIARLLGEQGIRVARRTVAKYREAMAIPSSSERRRLV
ncbi:RNA polymerase factor sigma-54 [Inmirania thermothiophila]|uniref:RNA polymerase sigma-54 factor n=1 Tax=Inmirania thermothiophila TaxID=1750597 RepID=A0A3N1XU17_9GAMM|nr:RNA polymerase factor sigma-54 [Inmirania thermothiophila]ROR29758.1 RNA polymerase RpoN-/SigL-like sigma 54 subunit [Inmirania thermothiophila]